MKSQNPTHVFTTTVVWDGGQDTSSYASYSRDFRVEIEGKPDLAGSADPAFRGTPDRVNPEDLFVSALSACHMLTYLALCARSGVRVQAYSDHATGILEPTAAKGGSFTSVLLEPVVTLAADQDAELAGTLHRAAHERCFIANSCSVPVEVQPTVKEGT